MGNDETQRLDELDVAVIGMSGRFPGAANVDEFWRNLAAGVESIHFLSERELRQAGVSEAALADPDYVLACSRLDGIELFDADFFGYSPREAAGIDPQQRLLLETAWEALEDAGYNPSSGRGAVGVFASASASTYLLSNLHSSFDFREFILSSGNIQSVLGNGGDFPATRISYKLNLTGPSINVQTACSSSLVAVHMARQSLLAGECDMALAGGVSLYLPQNQGYRYEEGMIFSPDGHCRVFDEQAGGTVFGRGAGMVLLKTLVAAVRDGDHVYATIKGSAINNDGALKAGFTAPSVAGQASVIAEALANSGVGPETIGYVEAHGTGTKQGDPIEIAGLTQAYRQSGQRTGYCAIGSVKSNIGHLDVASGVVGLIKAALMLDRGQMPPTLHFQRPNPEIDFAASPFFVNTSLRSWPRGPQLRRAGVSSFGMGGTNAHVILEEAPAIEETRESPRSEDLFTLSAKTPRALMELAGRYAAYVAEHPEVSIADLCYTANTGRAQFAHRVALSAKNVEELRQQLEKIAAGEAAGDVHSPPTDWQAFYSTEKRQRLRLPTYPFQRERHWVDVPNLEARVALPGHPWLAGAVVSPRLTDLVYEIALGARTPAFLSDHRISGACVFPATGYLEAVRATFAKSHEGNFEIQAMVLEDAFVLPETGTRTSQLILSPIEGESSAYNFEFHSLEESEGTPHWRRHATGTVRAVSGPHLDSAPKLSALAGRDWIQGAEFYARVQLRGLEYGDSFRGITRIRVEKGAAEVETRVPESLNGDHLLEYGLHPALFDAGLQAVLACLEDEAGATTYLPVGFRKACFLGNVKTFHSARVRATRRDDNTYSADLELLDLAGRVVIRIEGLSLRPLRRENKYQDYLYRETWLPKPIPLPLSLTSIATDASNHFEELAAVHDLSGYASLAPELDALCADYAAAALEHLGWKLTAGQRRDAETLADELKILPAHRRMFRRVLEMLEEDGVLRLEQGMWTVHRAPAAHDPGRLPKMLERWPACQAEISMTARCGADLAAVLNGSRDPIDLLFPAGSLHLLEAIYHRAPFTRVYNGLVAQAIAGVVASLPPGQKLRILEIGAGTGGTTGFVLPLLPAGRTEYVYTDVSPLFLARAEERFSEFPFVKYQTLDIDQPPKAQGFDGLTFDVVIASNVLHATKDLRATMLRAAHLTAPSGLLVMVEGIRPQRWVDLIFGLTEGWWKFTDRGLRPSYPLLSVSQWKTLLPAVGFARVASLPQEHDRAIFDQAVILAQKEPVQRISRCLILTDGGGFADRLSERLRGRGCECVLVRTGEPVPELDGYSEIVHLSSITDVDQARDLTPEHVAQAQESGCRSALELTKAIIESRTSDPPRLWLVTRGVQALGGQTSVDAANATLLGLGRVIAREHPELRCTRIDLSPVPASDEMDRLCEELVSPDNEREIAYRGGRRYGRRLDRCAPPEAESGERRLVLSRPGEPDSLAFQSCERTPPGPDELEIEVRATGLNFRDVLVSLGIYPDASAPLGGECAGVVTAVGAGVEDWKVGDAVLAMAPNSFATHVVAPAATAVRKPQRLSFEEAASIPGAFLTAHYALRTLANLSARDRVLIHSAAGGVGLAAVQFAQQTGAEIFATAGSEEKRRYLASIGVKHVFDSRSTAFAAEILNATGGKGVDVILNSLAGEAIESSVQALAADGRFVELGKRGIWSAARFHASRPASQYFAIDVAAECARHPEQFGRMLRDLVAQFESGALVPLPRRVFDWKDIGMALRLMASARHLGKIVVRPRSSGVMLRGDGTYLITGGLGGLGILVAGWMVDQGARHLILLGRHAPSREAQQSIDRWKAEGADVVVALADVSNESELSDAVTAGLRDRPVLHGVIHSAGALDDGVLHRQDWSRFETVMAAKVYGALHLHRLTRHAPLDFFILFSSAASMLGSPGQSNHAAANAFMDALANHRRREGLPALAIDWGVWSGIGAAAERHVDRRMPIAGLLPLTPQLGLALFETLLNHAESQVGAFAMDWQAYAAATPSPEAEILAAKPTPLTEEKPRAASPKLNGAGNKRSSNYLDLIKNAPASQRRNLLAQFVEERIVKALGLDASRPPDRNRPLQELGLDSLLAVELRNVLSNGLGLSRRLPATLLFDYPSVTAITDYLAGELLPPDQETSPAPQVPARDTDWNEIADLSDEEAEALLLKELSQEEGT